MGTALFQPKGEKSQAQIIMEAVQDINYGTTLTYQRLTELTGFPKDIVINNIQTVNRRLLKARKKCLANIRNVGYQVAEPKDHERLANNRKKKSDRQLNIGVDILKNTDVSMLTQDEKMRHSHLLNQLSTYQSLARKKSAKAVVQAEKSLKSQRDALVEIDRLGSEIQALKELFKP